MSSRQKVSSSKQQKLGEYQHTVSSEQQFQDLSLTARVHAVLLTSQEFLGSVFNVRAENGHVHVSGSPQFWTSEDQIVRAVERVPGVNKVTTNLGDIPFEGNVV